MLLQEKSLKAVVKEVTGLTDAALIEEIQRLGLKAGDKTKLRNHDTLYRALDLDLYIDGREKDAFSEALVNAQKVIEDEDAQEADVLKADQALLDAAKALVKKGDKTALAALTDATASYKKENYLSAGWNAFEEAVHAAKRVLADPSARQEDVDQARQALAEAMRRKRTAHELPNAQTVTLHPTSIVRKGLYLCSLNF